MGFKQNLFFVLKLLMLFKVQKEQWERFSKTAKRSIIVHNNH